MNVYFHTVVNNKSRYYKGNIDNAAAFSQMILKDLSMFWKIKKSNN